MIGRLLVLVVWFTASVTACAATMDRCLTLDDPAKINIFKGKLTKAGVPYYMDGDIVCVTREHADRFTTVLLETFPPDSSRKLRVPPSPSGIPLNSTKLANPEEHAALEAELKQRGIWFTRDETGAVWYEVTREKEVQDIMFQIFNKHSKKNLNETLVNQFATSYVNRGEERLFTQALEKSGISYRVKEQGGRRWVTWSPEDDAKVKRIEEEVSDSILKKRAEQRNRQTR